MSLSHCFVRSAGEALRSAARLTLFVSFAAAASTSLAMPGTPAGDTEVTDFDSLSREFSQGQVLSREELLGPGERWISGRCYRSHEKTTARSSLLIGVAHPDAQDPERFYLAPMSSAGGWGSSEHPDEFDTLDPEEEGAIGSYVRSIPGYMLPAELRNPTWVSRAPGDGTTFGFRRGAIPAGAGDSEGLAPAGVPDVERTGARVISKMLDVDGNAFALCVYNRVVHE